jgi:branched-subunit amino acid transport protein
MMDPATRLWLVIVLVGASNYLARLSFIALLARRSMPPLAVRALRYVAVAMLAALVVPAVLATPAGPMLWPNPKLVAAIAAGVVAWFTRSTAGTLVTGMATLWLVQALGN